MSSPGRFLSTIGKILSSSVVHPSSSSAIVETDQGLVDVRPSSNLAHVNLSSVLLPGADLRNINFKGADLRNINFEGADLSGADLGGSNLKGANLRGANLAGANLGGADLSGAILTNIVVTPSTTGLPIDKTPSTGSFE